MSRKLQLILIITKNNINSQSTFMKAIVYTQYGSPEVLQMKKVEKPTPKSNEVLLRIKATAVNSGDVRLRKADPFAVRFIFGLIKPKITILGSVFSGEIESVGKDVKKFNVGDAVFGHTDMSLGSYTEYKSISEDASIALKPANVSHPEAAVIPFGGVTAWHFIKKALVKPGQKVIVVGASGAVGSAAVQIAKSLGAQVTGVCSTANIDLVKSIGADKVIDYTKQDFTTNGETVNSISISRSLTSLNKNGKMILSAAGMPEMIQGLWVSLTSSQKVLTGVISHHAADILFLKGLVETNQLKAVIDRTYALEQIPEAHAYTEKGHKKGNISIHI